MHSSDWWINRSCLQMWLILTCSNVEHVSYFYCFNSWICMVQVPVLVRWGKLASRIKKNFVKPKLILKQTHLECLSMFFWTFWKWKKQILLRVSRKYATMKVDRLVCWELFSAVVLFKVIEGTAFEKNYFNQK